MYRIEGAEEKSDGCQGNENKNENKNEKQPQHPVPRTEHPI